MIFALTQISILFLTGTISNQGNMLGANKTGHVSIAGTSATQVLNPQTQIRLGGPNTLVTSTGQILTSPTLQILNQIQVSVNLAGITVFFIERFLPSVSSLETN